MTICLPHLCVALAMLTALNHAGAQTWTQTSAPSNFWYSVASSGDGTKLVAAIANAGIYTSANSGSTWKPTSAPARYWNAVASSTDGTWLVAAAYADLSIIQVGFTHRPIRAPRGRRPARLADLGIGLPHQPTEPAWWQRLITAAFSARPILAPRGRKPAHRRIIGNRWPAPRRESG